VEARDVVLVPIIDVPIQLPPVLLAAAARGAAGALAAEEIGLAACKTLASKLEGDPAT